MHLLVAQQGNIDQGEEAIDLGQSAADLVVITSTDTELQGLARAKARLGGSIGTLRVANISRLAHNYSVDLYSESVLEKAKLIVLRILGGEAYWPYGLEEALRLARAHSIPLAVMPGCANPDDSLIALSTLPAAEVQTLWELLVEGGPANYESALRLMDAWSQESTCAAPLERLAKVGLWDWRDGSQRALGACDFARDAKLVPLIFYRALLAADDLAPIMSLSKALAERGLTPCPIFVTSLKDRECQAELAAFFAAHAPEALINLTAFAVGQVQGGQALGNVLDQGRAPVLQAILAARSREAWVDDPRGLGPRELAMHVALPEVDGRLSGAVISFKSEQAWDEEVQASLIGHAPDEGQIARLADKVLAWSDLRAAPREERQIAVILSRYPGHEGGFAHGVGLDTPASLVGILARLKNEDYQTDEALSAGDIFTCLSNLDQRREGLPLSLADYQALAAKLPPEIVAAAQAGWGEPERDAFFDAEQQSFTLPIRRHGKVLICLQPPRALEENQETYHDLSLAPPHGYLAFYLALRYKLGVHAVIHLGKHGTLEWLPGKALALGPQCTPEALLGPLPNLYPFIVNDPGEGCQAKRRSGALIIDHLTPPLEQSETYDALAELERLVDEYFEAANADPRRLPLLAEEIVALARATGLEAECGISRKDALEEALQKLDTFLCDLKALQIRGGLHVFGASPRGEARAKLLAAFARSPRGTGGGSQASLLRALADDLGLKDYDPLARQTTADWQGPRPEVLQGISASPWRSEADTRERLDALALALIGGEQAPADGWENTREVLAAVEAQIAPALDQSGAREMQALVDALDGRFIAPGPSGAPTRGRVDVLPTGRNFFAVDTRAVPTPASFQLGQAAADKLVTLYRQDHGEWPKRIAMTAWGTANMRTGGDDIAIALALIGVRPTWDAGSFRLTGFELISLQELGRPRTDIVMRLSGFFRDAFPEQIALINSAVAMVAQLAEPLDANPLIAREGEALKPRLYSNAPGAFGGGVKGPALSGQWQDRAALGAEFLQAGGYALRPDGSSEPAQDAFKEVLAGVDAVSLTQDSREFDLLDSDDFFDFEGGLAAAAELAGAKPALYHGDSAMGTEPTYRTLADELSLIVRGRAANPRWIAAMKGHGGRGAFEMARSLHALYGFAATTDAARSSHFEALFDAFILDEDTRAFIAKENPEAYESMIARFTEAQARDFWQPRRNSTTAFLKSRTEL